MRLKIFLILFLMLSNASLFLHAQQVNTLYFMKDVPVRHFLNPSFQPATDFYLSLPVLGYTQFSVGNNSLSLKDVIYNVNGNTVSFLSPLGDVPRFYNTLKSNTVIRTDIQTNLLSFGFRHESAYWTFSLTEKIDGTVNLPKDIFNISLFGTPNPNNNSFDFSRLESDISAYTEAALGYSNQINDQWVIGGKIKLLLGSVNISNTNNQFLLKAGVDNWLISGNGNAHFSGPVQLGIGNNFQSSSYSTPKTIMNWLKPSGTGVGIDLGFEYRLNKKIKLSGALNDVGFIHWTQNSQNIQFSTDYSFSGIKTFDSNTTLNTFKDVYNELLLNNGLIDSIAKAFKLSSASKHTTDSYTTATTAKINLGFEYTILNNKLSFGLLSYSQLFKRILTEELTVSVNARPYNWLDASVSYSVFNSRMSTIGAGLGIKTGFVHWFIAADYIPFQKATLTLPWINNSNIDIPIPYNSKSFNLSVGLNLVFDKMIRTNRGLLRTNQKQACNCEWK